MPTGYVRQRAADIADGKSVAADVFNDEFNLVQSAFNAVTGHNHDGTTGGGAPINLANSTTGTLTVAKGGTGAVTLTAKGVVLGNGTNAVTVTAAGSNGQVLRVSGTDPGFGAIDLSNVVAVAGILPVVNGGTGANNATTARANLGVFDIANRKSNLSAITSPTSVNDSGQDYGIGSIWINTASDQAFICVDATPGAAIWKQFTS